MSCLIRVVLFTLLILCSKSTAASDGFTILTQVEKSYEDRLFLALEASNLDHYRLLDRRTILIIDKTIYVELLSTQECLAQGIDMSSTSFRQGSPIYDEGELYLDSSGILIEKKKPHSNH